MEFRHWRAGRTWLRPAVPRARVQRSRATRAVARSCRRLRRRRCRPALTAILARTAPANTRGCIHSLLTGWQRGLPPPARQAGPTPAGRASGWGRACAWPGAGGARPARRRVRCVSVRLMMITSHARPEGWKLQQQRAPAYHLAPRAPARPRCVAGPCVPTLRMAPLLTRLGPAAREARRWWLWAPAAALGCGASPRVRS